MHYDLTPEQLAEFHRQFVTELGVSVIGGCCGTTPAHLAAVVEACADLTPATRDPEPELGAASIYTQVPFAPGHLVPGRRRAHQRQRLEEVPRGHARGRLGHLRGHGPRAGQGGLPPPRRLRRLHRRRRRGRHGGGRLPLRHPVDRPARWSTPPRRPWSRPPCPGSAAGRSSTRSTSRRATSRAPGSTPSSPWPRSSAPPSSAPASTPRARPARPTGRCGPPRPSTTSPSSATGCDPRTSSSTPWSCPCRPAWRRAGGTASRPSRASGGSRPSCPASTPSSGSPTSRSASTRPPARSSTRSSSTSASRPASTRPSSTPRKILPLSKIDERAREVCLDLIYDRRRDGYDPLSELLAIFEGVSASTAAATEDRIGMDRSSGASSTGSSTATATGSRPTSTRPWPAARRRSTIVNDFLLAGMKTVGELFASGEMQLPFVLGSAETMKTAVAYLEPHMEKADQGGKGVIVLATVKGDVHDIGKNLVDIILTNNGYTVKNLGIKVGIAEMVSAARGVRGRRHRHERPAGQVDPHHAREPRGAEPPRPGPHPGHPGRGRPHPHLRRARPPAGLRGPALLRQGRLRGPAHHGPAGRADRERRGRPRVRHAPSAVATSGPARASCASRRPRRPGPRARPCPPARPRWPTDNPVFTPPVPRAAGWPRASPSTTSPPTSTRPPSSATSGATGPRTARTTPPSRSGSAACCASSWPRPRPDSSSCPRWPGATSPPTPTATTWSSARTRAGRASCMRFTFPRQTEEPVAVHQRLLPAVDSGEPDYASFQW